MNAVAERDDMMVPHRSYVQRMSALNRANEIRTYRADLKKDIKAGRENPLELLAKPPEKIDTMKIVDFMLSLPKMGRVKVDKILRQCRISPSKTIGGLSDRQRSELVLLLRRR